MSRFRPVHGRRPAFVASLAAAGLGWAVSLTALADDFEAQCRTRLAPTDIRVVLGPSGYSTDFSKSYRELSGYAKTQAGHTNLGHVETKRGVQVTTGSNYLVKPDGTGCLRPSLRVEFNYAPMTMRIAKELKGDQCAFDFVLRHELKHVSIYDRFAKLTANRLEEALRKHFGQNIYYGRADELNAQLKSAVQDYWLPQAMAWLAEADPFQAAIDTPEEYAKSNTACGGVIPKLLKAGR